jgi:hypothetical protein
MASAVINAATAAHARKARHSKSTSFVMGIAPAKFLGRLRHNTGNFLILTLFLLKGAPNNLGNSAYFQKIPCKI